MSGGLRPVRFPVGTRLGSGDQGKSPARQPCTHPPPRLVSSFESLEPWAGCGWECCGTFTVKVMGLCHGRWPVWQAMTASCVHCSSGNEVGPRIGPSFRWGGLERGISDMAEGGDKPERSSSSARGPTRCPPPPPAPGLPKAINKLNDILHRKWPTQGGDDPGLSGPCPS